VAVNEWIRNSGAFDGVIDFDAVVRDPADPTRMLPAYDKGDNLHPNDAGYKAMAESIDLGLPVGKSD
jgi:lysophospholipase L1-like esterase